MPYAVRCHSYTRPFKPHKTSKWTLFVAPLASLCFKEGDEEEEEEEERQEPGLFGMRGLCGLLSPMGLPVRYL